jgi:hypothetical protein
MEVHPPHGPIHTFKDFLIHLLTITIGLLIALGLEGAVEAVHHHSQVAEARESILHEIGANRAELQKHMERLSGQEKTIASMRSGLELPHPAANPDDHLNVSVAGLRRAAYETAIATGTLALMDYTEASRYAQTYQEQTVLDALQNNAVFQIEMSLVAALPGPANSLTGVEKLSQGQFASLKEKMDAYRAQLVLYRAAAKELDEEYGKYAGQ